jgi:hypothetical protein
MHAGTMDIIGLTEKKLKLNTHEAIMKLKEWAKPAIQWQWLSQITIQK